MGVVTRFDGVTLTGGYTNVVVRVDSGQNYLKLQKVGSGLAIADVNATEIAVNAELFFDITYYFAATA
jgi:hypothetical protein